MSKPIGYVVTAEGGQLAKDAYGGVLLFKTAEDALWFISGYPFYKNYHRLIRAKVPRKRAKKQTVGRNQGG